MVARVDCVLAGGQFVAPTAPVAFTPPVELNSDSLYVLQQIGFGANIPEADFQDGIQSGIPTINFVSSVSRTALLRQAIPLPRYLESADLVVSWMPRGKPNFLQAQMVANLTQTPNLALVATVSFFVTLSVYEVTDKAFVKAYAEKYHA
jgi:hypothetical protein